MTPNKKFKIVKDFRAIIKALQMEGLEDLENPAGYQCLEDLEFTEDEREFMLGNLPSLLSRAEALRIRFRD